MKNQTTVTTAGAGAAIGIVVTWLLSSVVGVDVSAEAGAAFSTLGAFAFGLIFHNGHSYSGEPVTSGSAAPAREHFEQPVAGPKYTSTHS